MDAIQLLKEDHDKVKKLFQDFESSGEKAYVKKQEIADKICEELEVHTQIEEEIFYPQIRKATKDDEAQDLLNEAFEEHKVAKTLVAELQDFEEVNEIFEAKMKVLRENVEHHIKEEQNELFPKVKKTFEKEELEEIGTQMKERKLSLLSQDSKKMKKGKVEQTHLTK